MVAVLVILDGAADRRGTLERARMPVLRSLGRPQPFAVTPAHLPPGSETGIPVLLGHVPAAPVGRGWVDAAAYGVAVPAGDTPRRIDVLRPDGTRATGADARAVAHELGATHTRGHRLLITDVRGLRVAERPSLHTRLKMWAAGASLPRVLDEQTVVIGAPGAAIGCARLMGARTITPPGATGDTDTDLAAKAREAVALVEQQTPRIVVHVGAPDEAAHRRNPAEKQRALELIDAHLLDPIVDAVRRHHASIEVTADHATDPVTGEHGREAVPRAAWRAATEAAAA